MATPRLERTQAVQPTGDFEPPKTAVLVTEDSIRIVPSGGRPGQVLGKRSSRDWDVQWVTPEPGTGDGAREVFVQPDEPQVPGPFIWVQTGLGVDGSGFTIWFEDGV